MYRFAMAKNNLKFCSLFGNEDVDLRQLPPVLSPPPVVASTSAPTPLAAGVCRPPTPPPPIISSSLTPEKAENKENTSPASTSAKSSLDAIRQKLANASKISAKLSMSFFLYFDGVISNNCIIS